MRRLEQHDVDREDRMTRTPLPFRLPLLALLTFALIFLPPRVDLAAAGAYDVWACNGFGGPSGSFASFADPGMTAYHTCHTEDGIVARNVAEDANAGGLHGAYQVFEAPPGTVAESIHFAARIERPDCRWGVQIIAGDRPVWGLGPDSNSNCGVYGIGWLRWDIAVNDPRVRFESRCLSAWCPRNGTNGVFAKDIRVHVRDDIGPSVGGERGSLWADGWLNGSRDVAFDASDGAGIRETIVRVDGQEVKRNAKPCDYTQRAPCPQEGFATMIETTAIKPDGKHRLAVEAVDAGGNVATSEREVLIDNTSPGPPQNLTLAGGDGWRAENDFDLSWTNPTESGVAPIAGVEYELCPTGGGRCTRGSRSVKGLTSLADLKLPGPGEYALKLWLRDEAGNGDPRTAAPVVHLRFDDFAPDLEFEPTDPGDPTLLSVRAVDRGSGLAQAQIEIKPRTSANWQPLETRIGERRVVARFDDERMRDGLYDLRAHAVDFAANERTSETRGDGERAAIRLPVRVQTRLRVGLKRPGVRRVRYGAQARVPFGRPGRFRGRLLSRDRNPVQDAEILVFAEARRQGAPERLVATLKTTRRGGFAYRAPRGVSRTLRFRYGGTATVRSATRQVELLVRACSTIRPNRRSFVNGERMELRGRLRGRDIPPEGKLIELQVLLRGKWRTFATTRADIRGFWRYDYRFDGTRGLQTYRFRARVPREATYPYESGVSRVVKVRVRGV
jgi:hypothetical protein